MQRTIYVAGYAPDEARRAVAASLKQRVEDAQVEGIAIDADLHSAADEHTLLRKGPYAIVAAVDDVPSLSKRIQFSYHARALVTPSISPENAAEYLFEAIFKQPMREFVSTRATPDAEGKLKHTSFLGAVKQGLAMDGGLYVPKAVPPPFPRGLLEVLASAEAADYAVTAQLILERLVDRSEVPPGVLNAMITKAYDVSAWSNDSLRCPVSDVTTRAAAEAGVHVALSQQFVGPTSAFKDFALQLFPQWFDLATMFDDSDENAGGKYLILTATSGDTGGAAINGFVRGAPDIKIMVLYPSKGVSPVQRLQMLSMNGGNVHVVAVDDDFDFCQTTVKRIFNDEAVRQQLVQQAGTFISSANSINWGRLLPQVVYYFHNYASLVRSGKLAFGDKMDVCVPTGNFGNILACYLARKLGLPVARLVLASNNNDVLHEFVSTGTYDISKRALELTASPSIDILKASNVERFLHLVLNGDGAAVGDMMHKLNTEKRFVSPDAVTAELKSVFWSGKCDEATCRSAIKRVHDECGTVVDPHTGVAMEVVRQYIAEVPAEQRAKVLLVASTAHWAKFPEPVAEALGVVDKPSLKGNAARAGDIRELYEKVYAAAPTTAVSASLSRIFQSETLVEDGPKLNAHYDEIVADLLRFAGAVPPSQ